MATSVEKCTNWPNLVEMFFDQAERLGDAPMLSHKIDGAWVAISWRAAAQTVSSVAAGLRAIGIKPGDRVRFVPYAELLS